MGKRPLMRLAAAAAGGVLALMATAPAWAIVLNLTNPLPIRADEFETQQCDDERMADRQPDEDGWHFVAAGGSFLSITVTFAPDPDNPTEDLQTFTGTPAAPGEFTFYDAGPNANLHAYLFTPAGWLLVDAQADVEGAQQFTLSHTCPGTPPDDETTPPDDETTPPGDETTPPGDETTPPGDETTPPSKGEKPGLPVTGMSVGGLLILSGGLLSAGIALMAVRRRRSLSNLLDN